MPSNQPQIRIAEKKGAVNQAKDMYSLIEKKAANETSKKKRKSIVIMRK